MTKATKHTRALTGTAMLAAVATILMYMEFPIPIMPGFIKMDISELPALIASFAYGPLSGIAVCLIKNLIKLPSTSTGKVTPAWRSKIPSSTEAAPKKSHKRCRWAYRPSCTAPCP